MALAKKDIVELINDRLGFNRVQGFNTVEALLKIMKQTMESGEDVLISGFGKFCVKEKKERKGRNPATEEDMILKQRV